VRERLLLSGLARARYLAVLTRLALLVINARLSHVVSCPGAIECSCSRLCCVGCSPSCMLSARTHRAVPHCAECQVGPALLDGRHPPCALRLWVGQGGADWEPQAWKERGGDAGSRGRRRRGGLLPCKTVPGGPLSARSGVISRSVCEMCGLRGASSGVKLLGSASASVFLGRSL